MSLESIVWAYQQEVGNPYSKAILVCLADMANHEHVCWPGINHICKRTELCRRTVINHIKKLESTGFISKTVRGGDGEGRKSNLYTINVGQSVSVTRGQCASPAPPRASEVGQCASPAPESTINLSIESKPTGQKSADASFDRFWSAYPKKVDKLRARKAWKRKKLDSKADMLIKDVEARLKSDFKWIKNKGKYIPMPTTYLNGERWEDEFQELNVEETAMDYNRMQDNELLKLCKDLNISTVGLSRFALIERLQQA